MSYERRERHHILWLEDQQMRMLSRLRKWGFVKRTHYFNHFWKARKP